MKKLFAFLLAMMMVLSLAACGGGGDDKTPSSDDKTPSSSQQQEDKTPEADPVEDEPEDKGGEEKAEAAKRIITPRNMYSEKKDDGRMGEFFSIEMDANDKGIACYVALIFDTAENADAYANSDHIYKSGSYADGRIFYGYWKDLSGKSKDEVVAYIEGQTSNDLMSEVDMELDIDAEVPIE